MTDRKDWYSEVYQVKDLSTNWEEWRQVSKKVFRRDGYSCRLCRKQFKLIDLDAHHLIPRAIGGIDDEGNLITLCEHCHNHIESLDFTTAEEFYKYRRDYQAPRIEIEEPDESEPPTSWRAVVYGGLRPRW
jgi:hypothetical protein